MEFVNAYDRRTGKKLPRPVPASWIGSPRFPYLALTPQERTRRAPAPPPSPSPPTVQPEPVQGPEPVVDVEEDTSTTAPPAPDTLTEEP